MQILLIQIFMQKHDRQRLQYLRIRCLSRKVVWKWKVQEYPFLLFILMSSS